MSKLTISLLVYFAVMPIGSLIAGYLAVKVSLTKMNKYIQIFILVCIMIIIVILLFLPAFFPPT